MGDLIYFDTFILMIAFSGKPIPHYQRKLIRLKERLCRATSVLLQLCNVWKIRKQSYSPSQYIAPTPKLESLTVWNVERTIALQSTGDHANLLEERQTSGLKPVQMQQHSSFAVRSHRLPLHDFTGSIYMVIRKWHGNFYLISCSSRNSLLENSFF